MTQADIDPSPATTERRPTLAERLGGLRLGVRSYFTEQDPTFWVALTPALVVAALLFVRSPLSNYIFDEQEALLANPYVNGKVAFTEVVRRDFWGLPSDRSIGSYRPIPNVVWRLLWSLSELPFLHHWVNVVGHALNGTLLASFVLALTRRRGLAWLAGACFLTSAVLTEAITGVVGIADVLAGLGVMLALSALRLPLWAMPFGVLAALAFGLFSKESALVGVPLLGWAALVTAPALHARPRRLLRAGLAFVGALGAFVLYTEFRRHFFPVPMGPEFAAALPASEPWTRRAVHEFLRWFQQPQLPRDPINNPLVDTDLPHRIAGALRVFWRGTAQLLLPWHLSGDYSAPAEPVPGRVVFPESVLGGLLLAGLPVVGLGAWLRALWLEHRLARMPSPRAAELAPLHAVALGAVWLPVAYFPLSNIAVLLPTVRAERFWYLPAIGGALLLSTTFTFLVTRFRAPLTRRVVIAFFVVQAVQARAHAFDYSDDLAFWDATRRAAPNSAKAHLNYSVMVGARDRLPERLEANRRALELAPRWPMAHVYYGDTLCRMKRPDEAWPHYRRGFELGLNDSALIALALQCLWDKGRIDAHKDELLALADAHPGSWLAFLASDIVHSGKEHGGVQKKYRPRSYDEGPKDGGD